MTLMLASVTSPAEAETVRAEGADIIDLKDPSQGALAPLDAALAADIVRLVARRRPVSATAGAAHPSHEAAVEAVVSMAATGVDFVKIGFPSVEAGAERVRALGTLAAQTRLVGVLFADREPNLDLIEVMAGQGFAGAMLDTEAKGSGRLLDHMGIAALHHFVSRCRAAGLMAGLAGSLEAPDVPRLLPLNPDYLGFRGALCHGRARTSEIDPPAVRLIRDLIPSEAGGAVREHIVEARLGAALLERALETDRVFVHDLVMACAIGAYDHERGIKQNVRFNVDVDVRRATSRSDDMRDIFSYDLITDSIKIILGRGHIDLIETLARDLADSVLRHPSVVRVCVRIEKLDVIRGAVGVEIRRERASGPAAIDHLFPALTDMAGTASGH